MKTDANLDAASLLDLSKITMSILEQTGVRVAEDILQNAVNSSLYKTEPLSGKEVVVTTKTSESSTMVSAITGAENVTQVCDSAPKVAPSNEASTTAAPAGNKDNQTPIRRGGVASKNPSLSTTSSAESLHPTPPSYDVDAESIIASAREKNFVFDPTCSDSPTTQKYNAQEAAATSSLEAAKKALESVKRTQQALAQVDSDDESEDTPEKVLKNTQDDGAKAAADALKKKQDDLAKAAALKKKQDDEAKALKKKQDDEAKAAALKKKQDDDAKAAAKALKKKQDDEAKAAAKALKKKQAEEAKAAAQAKIALALKKKEEDEAKEAKKRADALEKKKQQVAAKKRKKEEEAAEAQAAKEKEEAQTAKEKENDKSETDDEDESEKLVSQYVCV